MQGNSVYEAGKMFLSTLIEKEYVLASVGGEEVYPLTNKADGTVFLIGFESRVAANRYFAGNSEYFYSKIN